MPGIARNRAESQWKSQADARASAPFSWKAFSERVPESEAQRAAAEQDKFRSRYCRLAGQLAGGDDGAAFPNADRALFQAINAGPDAAGQAKRDLELVVGKVAQRDWDDAASLAKELHAWRRGRVRASQQPQPPAAPLRTPEAPGLAGARGQQRGRSLLLFGSEISFNFDLDARAPEDSEDELDRAFPGVNSGGTSGGFAFDSFESFVGISADSGGGGGGGGGSGWGAAAAAASEPTREQWRPGKGATVDDQASSSSRGGEEEKKQPARDVGGAAAAGVGAAHVPPPSGATSSGKPGAGGAAAAAETFDAGWLYSRCMQFHAQQGSRGLPPVDLASSVLETLSRTTDPGELQGSLFDLLGEAGLELMMELIDKAPALGRIDARDLFAIADAHGGGGGGGGGGGSAGIGGFDGGGLAAGMAEMGLGADEATGRSGPTISRQIKIWSTSEKEAEKLRRKDLKKVAKRGGGVGGGQGQQGGGAGGRDGGGGLDWLQSVGFEEEYLKQERLLGLQAGGTGGGESEEAMMLAGLAPEGTREWHDRRSGMPAGATKTVVAGQYEQVHVPPPKLNRNKDGEGLVPITDLEPWAQVAFKGTKRLNPMQSKASVYHAAFKTSENLLVCAPTGAGKTNVAMLSLLQA
ncbi:unnamed protein product, partial [Ectocarpus fasciculatus]